MPLTAVCRGCPLDLRLICPMSCSREEHRLLGCGKQCKHLKWWQSCFLRICPGEAEGAVVSETLQNSQCIERQVELWFHIHNSEDHFRPRMSLFCSLKGLLPFALVRLSNLRTRKKKKRCKHSLCLWHKDSKWCSPALGGAAWPASVHPTPTEIGVGDKQSCLGYGLCFFPSSELWK